MDQEDDTVSIFDIVSKGHVTVLRAPCEVYESFDIADEDKYDSHQHFVTKGNRYMVCKYFTKSSESSKGVQYKVLSNDDVYILPGEVLCPFVQIRDSYVVEWEEKQWLDDCALNTVKYCDLLIFVDIRNSWFLWLTVGLYRSNCYLVYTFGSLG